MPKQKLLMLIASVLIIVGLIGVFFTFPLSGSESKIEKTETIQNTEINKIAVKTENARMDVIPTSDDYITVEFSAPESRQNKYKLEIEEQGNSLEIELKEKHLRFFQLDFTFSGPELTIYLPEKQWEELSMRNINGKIVADNITVSNLNAKTTNGVVHLTDIETNSATATSKNGNITFEHVDGEITMDVVNGNTKLITDNLDRSIQLESVNGTIKIETEEEPTNTTIEADVKNGKVSIFGDDTRNVRFGEGKHSVKLKTVNGKISVN